MRPSGLRSGLDPEGGGSHRRLQSGEGHDLICVLTVFLWLPERGYTAGAMLGAGSG